jgi:hypothetical protein
MSASAPQPGSVESRDHLAGASAGGRESDPSRVRITVIVQNRCTLDARPTTGKQIKEKADVPAGFVLYRRVKGGNEPIADGALIEPHNGDHFFARPADRDGEPR